MNSDWRPPSKNLGAMAICESPRGPKPKGTDDQRNKWLKEQMTKGTNDQGNRKTWAKSLVFSYNHVKN